ATCATCSSRRTRCRRGCGCTSPTSRRRPRSCNATSAPISTRPPRGAADREGAAVVSVWFEGIEEMNTITASLEADKGRVGALGSKVIRAYALKVEGTAKVFCPVDTGHLKGSIGPPTYEGDGRYGEITATITAAANYAAYVEY